VAAARQSPEHRGGVFVIARLAQDVAVDDDGGVGAEDDGVGRRRAARQYRQGRQRFLAGETTDVGLRRFARADRFVDVGGDDIEFESCRAQQLGTPRRCRRQDQSHERNDKIAIGDRAIADRRSHDI